MRFFEKVTPLQKEWKKLELQEQKLLQKRKEQKDSILNRKLEEKIPPKLQGTLDTAFAKAFALIFEKGTGIIEKTYQREKLEQDYKIRQYAADIKQNSKLLRSFSKKARDTGTKNLLLSGASGIGMMPEGYQEKEQIEQTAGALSKELLYMKFLQGIPVVGAVGGAYDAIYMKRIAEYAGLKYRHRYLKGQKNRRE